MEYNKLMQQIDETETKIATTNAPYQSHEYLQLLARRSELWDKVREIMEE
tara:strand:+ start:383 stop:532 length:150 start_codon:yes stop_codon:yes gene_type:complete